MSDDGWSTSPPVCRVFKFGNENSQDVILEVGDAEFYVNKGMLSAQSDFFCSLFNPDSKKKNEERVKIEADKIAFLNLMEIIFNFRIKSNIACPIVDYHGGFGGFESLDEFRSSSGLHSAAKRSNVARTSWAKVLWRDITGTLELIDRFQMTASVKRMVSDKLKDSNCNKENCVNCALKIFLRCTSNLFDKNEDEKITPFAFKTLFIWYGSVIGDFTMNGKDMNILMDKLVI